MIPGGYIGCIITYWGILLQAVSNQHLIFEIKTTYVDIHANMSGVAFQDVSNPRLIS